MKNKVLHNIKWTLLAAVLVAVSSVLFSIIRISLFPSATDQTGVNTYGLVDIVITIIVSPIIEEWIFRKKLPQLLSRILKDMPSMLISNLIFAVLHMDSFFIPYFVNGCVYLGSYKKTKCLAVPIVAHGLYNLFVLAVAS